MSGESGVRYKGASSNGGGERMERNDHGDRGGWCTSEQRYKGTNKERERERVSFSRLTLRNEQNLRAAAFFPSKIDTTGLHHRFDSACIRLAFAAHSSLSLSIYLSIFLFFAFPTKRPASEWEGWWKKKKGNTRACRSSRREALWSLDEKRRRNGLDGEKASLGSVPLVTVNSNKGCLRIGSFNRTGRQTFSRTENHRRELNASSASQKPYRNDALRSPRQFPPIRIENFEPVLVQQRRSSSLFHLH